ncbi:uncharacterized protein [Venturia canescens]|uniref:uncharacterized protein isoform X1 n=1 Tax=Venturia canescens TaxID=32260 RepID=UPI001C9C2CB8|nr:uncharacterized protein LOC122418252 isoform X1 [Venturia canescens]
MERIDSVNLEQEWERLRQEREKLEEWQARLYAQTARNHQQPNNPPEIISEGQTNTRSIAEDITAIISNGLVRIRYLCHASLNVYESLSCPVQHHRSWNFPSSTIRGGVPVDWYFIAILRTKEGEQRAISTSRFTALAFWSVP